MPTVIPSVSAGECDGDFDPSTEICCGTVVNPKPPNPLCCLSKAYNRLEWGCCDGVLSPSTAENGGCCGYIALDRDIEHCCITTINIRKSDNVSCCVHVGFDRWTEMCCNDQVRERPPNALCCGSESYNAGTHRCCFGELIIPIGEACPVPSSLTTSVDSDLPDKHDEEVKIAAPRKKQLKKRISHRHLHKPVEE